MMTEQDFTEHYESPHNRFTPQFVERLEPNECFVFGSNLAGRHGAGAAKHAAKHFGAIYGQGEGPQGQSYAIPTKDSHLKVSEISAIGEAIYRFTEYAKAHPNIYFLVTAIGTGYAGYDAVEIAPYFSAAAELTNVSLPEEFWNLIQEFNAEIESDWS